MPGTSPTMPLILAPSASGVDGSYSPPLILMVGVALIFAAAASPVTLERYLPLLTQSGTLPTTPASRASSINLALSGKLAARSLGWMSVLYSAVWKRRNASMDSSATQSAAAPARDE